MTAPPESSPWQIPGGGPWDPKGIVGIRRLLERIWELKDRIDETKSYKDDRKYITFVNQVISKVTHDIENLRFNTAISSLMIFSRFGLTGDSSLELKESLKQARFPRDAFEILLVLLSPFAPHMVSEIWEKLGHKDSIFDQPWPTYDEKLIKEEEVNLVIQVNGKLRDRISVPVSITEAEAKQLAMERQRVKSYLESKDIVKIIYVPGRLVNLVVK